MAIPFKSKLKGFRNIENRNKAFDKLTDRQKRQEIAYDALKLLLAGKIKAEEGTYWGDELHDVKNIAKNAKDFQKKLCSLNNVKCEVCARGAMMLSTVRLGNKIEPNDAEVTCGNSSNIKGFDFDDFERMEGQFECFHYNSIYEDEDDYSVRAEKNLANILCNVIKNGNFKCEDLKDYLTLWKIKL